MKILQGAGKKPVSIRSLRLIPTWEPDGHDDVPPVGSPNFFHVSSMPTEVVNVSDLVAVQGIVYPEKVLAMLAAGSVKRKDPMKVMKGTDGMLYVEDGHHGVIAAIIRGDSTVNAQVFDFIDDDEDDE